MSYKSLMMSIALAFATCQTTQAIADVSTTISSPSSSTTPMQQTNPTPAPASAPQQRPAQGSATQMPEFYPPKNATEAALQKNIFASQKVADAWLKTMDADNYGASWDNASRALQYTMKRKEWEDLMNTTRKPLGRVSQRIVEDIRTAKDPQGAAPGDYMIFIYNTTFSKGPAKEILTLQENHGTWHIFTYTISAQ